MKKYTLLVQEMGEFIVEADTLEINRATLQFYKKTDHICELICVYPTAITIIYKIEKVKPKDKHEDN